MKPFELKSMTYEEARREHFTLLMNKAKRKKDYWSARLDHKRPDNLMDEAHIKASDAGWEYNFYKDALEALENQPKWISVDERLPDAKTDVLACGDVIKTAYTRGAGEGWFTYDGNKQMHNVTHWMPLPSCPEEDS